VFRGDPVLQSSRLNLRRVDVDRCVLDISGTAPAVVAHRDTFVALRDQMIGSNEPEDLIEKTCSAPDAICSCSR